eukprot:3669800-Prymnesium_polylepis.1
MGAKGSEVNDAGGMRPRAGRVIAGSTGKQHYKLDRWTWTWTLDTVRLQLATKRVKGAAARRAPPPMDGSSPFSSYSAL